MQYPDISAAMKAHRQDVNPDSHLWLYAKNHYIRHNVWEDLKLLVALRCGLEPEHVTKGGVLMVLGNIVIPILHGSINELENFIGRLSPEHLMHYSLRWGHNKDLAPEPYEDVLLAAYLSIMSLQTVRDGDKILIPLDEADPDLLPTTRKCKKGGDHEKGTDGMHTNVFCTKCFQPLDRYQ